MRLLYLNFFGLPCQTRKRINYQTLNYVCQEGNVLEKMMINIFGYGGINAHVIVDRMDEPIHPENNVNGINGTNGVNGSNDINGNNGVKGTNSINGAASESHIAAERPRVFILSAAEEQSCHKNAERLAQYLTESPDALLKESNELMDRLAITVNKRTVHEYNAFIVTYDQEDLVAQLEVLQQTPIAVRAPFKGGARVAYVDDKGLATFCKSLDRANTHLRMMGCEWDLLTESSHEKAEDSHVDEPVYGQTLSTVIQLALVDTLAALNLSPSSVVGHSSGEIAAAYAVGALSFEDALTVAYYRGRLTSKLIASGVSGGMLAVGLSPEVAQTYIDQVKATDNSEVKIACYNSPASVTLSGDDDSIAAVAALLQQDDVFHRKLRTRGAAYHSQMMQAIEEDYRSAITHIQPRPLAGHIWSSLNGKKLSAGFLLDGDYWARNLVSPVLFAGALSGMIVGEKHEGQQRDLNIDLLLEIGPHAQMQGAAQGDLATAGIFNSRALHVVS
ncbi:acyl transferase/acyl hydrolase/lysophospholipase [Aspergillus desertorum]